MHTPDSPVTNRITQWADSHPLVRAAILTSTRAKPNATLDALSDYDIVLAVSDTAPFIDKNIWQEEAWLWDFGSVMVRFKDTFSEFNIEHYTRLLIYQSGVKIDFSIWPIELLQAIVASPALPAYLDDGYQVLVDKDHLTKGLKPPNFAAYIPQIPSLDEYQALINTFWWETTYVAKYLWRDELFPAKYSFDHVIKYDLLLKMIEWRLEIEHNWQLSLGYFGRYLKDRLDEDLWGEITSTFVGADLEKNWQALFHTTKLFRKISIEVGNALGYVYLYDLDKQVSRYIRSIKAKLHD